METLGPPQADPSTTTSRKALLLAFENAGYLKPFFALAVDLGIFAGGLALVLMDGAVWWKLLGTVLITAGIVRLFLIGHDACHGSFFKSQLLNDIFGRVAFLPSMTAFSLWDVGHNVAHHGFNNLKGRDQVWAPFSKEEFDALPRYRRVLERIYRSGAGWGLYYFLELWWKKLYFATRRQIGASRAKYQWDSVLVTVGMVSWIALVALVAIETEQSFWLLFVLGIVVPFALWNAIMGFVVFVHHTHPAIAWFQKRQEWQRYRAYLTATVHVKFPFGLDRLMHNIMEHNAHHLNPRIPMYSLRKAQRVLNERFNDQYQAYRMTWRVYRDCVRRCKLYDFANHAWLDFRGQVTSRVNLVAAPAG
ncbi:MAG: fatty acid desaturase [Sinobacteraceae bacterium]|nr:fatty acid desaturase [Nevskiaceae bacterium]